MNEGLHLLVDLFLVLAWPRIWVWMEDRDYAYRMSRWKELCPHGGLPEDNCRGCRTR